MSSVNWEAIYAGAMGAIATTVASIVSFSKGRADADNTRQKNVLDGFEALLNEMREERASMKEERVADKLRILELEGRCSALEQHILSLEEALRRQGLTVPRRPAPSAVVFTLHPPLAGSGTAAENDHG